MRETHVKSIMVSFSIVALSIASSQRVRSAFADIRSWKGVGCLENAPSSFRLIASSKAGVCKYASRPGMPLLQCADELFGGRKLRVRQVESLNVSRTISGSIFDFLNFERSESFAYSEGRLAARVDAEYGCAGDMSTLDFRVLVGVASLEHSSSSSEFRSPASFRASREGESGGDESTAVRLHGDDGGELAVKR